MRSLIRGFDRWLARRYRVFEFSPDPECILRLQFGRAAHSIALPEGDVQRGQSVLLLHFWNERLPPIPEDGPDLAWAKEGQRKFVHSLQQVGEYLATTPGMPEIQAVGATTALLMSGKAESGARMIRQLGFVVIPYRSPLGRFGEFWENFYSWLLVWAYNPVSLHAHPLFGLQRSEIWIVPERLVELYGRPSRNGGNDLTNAALR
jgi:hypothetical protein